MTKSLMLLLTLVVLSVPAWAEEMKVCGARPAHYGSPLQGLIPLAILNRLVLPAVED